MKTINDLSYYDHGFFTLFLPNTKEGEVVWSELASQTDGTAKVLTIHLGEVIKQLKLAGYTVGPDVHPNSKELDDILMNELLG